MPRANPARAAAAQTSTQQAAAIPTLPKPPTHGGATSAGAKVIVCCKHPQGLELRICQSQEIKEHVIGGGVRVSEQWFPTGDAIRVRGPAAPHGVQLNVPVVGGYALTYNVSKDFWDAWLDQNKLNPLVLNKMIFAYDDRDHAEGASADLAGVRSGLEPLVPDKDPRNPKPLSPDIVGVNTNDPKA